MKKIVVISLILFLDSSAFAQDVLSSVSCLSVGRVIGSVNHNMNPDDCSHLNGKIESDLIEACNTKYASMIDGVTCEGNKEYDAFESSDILTNYTE